MNQSIGFYTRIIPVFFITLIQVDSYSQVSKDSPGKYSDAYKKYLNAACPIEESNTRHFVYFSSDRDSIRNHPLLTMHQFNGAQVMYSWKDLEPEKDHYDFSQITQDYEYLKSYGKKLFIQLQDATFNPKIKAVPGYLLTKEYDAGAVIQVNDDGEPEGWVAKRWNVKVQHRFGLLLDSLGKYFDGKIEGINLQETSIGVTRQQDDAFSPALYAKCVKANMLSLKNAFPKSTTMQYANFMPGEWLPWDDKGYLRSVYAYGQQIGV